MLSKCYTLWVNYINLCMLFPSSAHCPSLNVRRLKILLICVFSCAFNSNIAKVEHSFVTE